MAFTKITNADLLNKGVVGLPDTPNLSTTEMQEKFDEIAKDVIVPKHNALIDELADIGAALNIGAVDPLGNPSTVQEQLNRQSQSGYTKDEADAKFVAQEVGKQLSTEDYTTADKDKLASLNNYVLPVGDANTLGGVKPDNTTFTIDSNGVGHAIGGGGGGGSVDYNVFINKPQIAGVELIGNKSLEDFGISKDTLVEITVNYDTPVIGATITCENGSETYSFTADSSLSHTFMCKSLGTWTVSEDAQGTSVEVEVTYYGRYSCTVGGDIAIVVNFGADMVGQTISCTKDGITKTKTASGTSVTFALADEGTYTIGETLNNTTSSVTVAHGNTYNVNFKANIQVSIPDTDIGNTITCSNGTHTYTWVSDSTTHTFVVSEFDDWSVANTTIGVTQVITVSAYTDYEVVIGGASIELTVTADFIGETITCVNGATTKTWVCDSTTHTFAVGLGTWTISSVVSGTTYSTEVVVTEYTTYTASLTMASYQGWLDSAGITTQYASLAEVLADQKTVRTLFTKKDSVDYLVSWAQIDNASATTIFNNGYCAKWINLRDYALDTLYADTTCKGLMDTADLYFYGELVEVDGEFVPKGNVPIMTADNAPYGNAFLVSASGTTRSARYVFDGVYSYADSVGFNSSANTKICYEFVNPISVKKFGVVPAVNQYGYYGTMQYQLYYSDNGTNWNVASEQVTLTFSDFTLQYVMSNVSGYHKYWGVSVYNTNGNDTYVSGLQFYGRELSVSVPTMDSNTSPWGEASASSTFSDYYPYEPFSNGTSSTTNTWISQSETNPWLQYDFGFEVVPKLIKWNNDADGRYHQYVTGLKLLGSNDGVQYTEITNIGANEKIVALDNISGFSKIRLQVLQSQSANTELCKVQFYCLDYSEHTERHYIYDHGVEVEEVTISGSQATATIDTTEYSLLRAEDTNHARTNDSLKCGSATAVVNGLPNNNYLPISNVNGSNATGFGNVDTANLDDTSFWVE